MRKTNPIDDMSLPHDNKDPLPSSPSTTNPTDDAMPVPRPAVALRAANALSYSTRLTASSQATTQQQCVRSFSSSRQQLAADHGAHEDHYDPPGGWLWGLDPSKKHEKEGWENIFFYGFFGSLGLSVIAYAFKPDTS
jgi:hypothetical protein